MERSYFNRVKEMFSSDHVRHLEKLGIEIGKGKGEWTQGKCPLCPDKSGSASFSKEGFLKCHQCGKKEDLFAWLGERDTLTPWDSLKVVADMVGFNMAPPRRHGRAPKEMNVDVLENSVHALWDSTQAKLMRQFLKERKLDDPVILERFGVGFMAGTVTFAQWSHDGVLLPRYRKFNPGGRNKWLWSAGSGAAVGFWPYVKVPPGGIIWIMEGEWDVLTAWIRLRLQDQNIYCFTWTGGAGAPIAAHNIPKAWHRQEIHLHYDNDVFQGPKIEDYYAPDDKTRHATLRRHANLLKIAQALDSVQCKVRFRACAVDPMKTWGGDFRDWVDEGGRDIKQIPEYPWRQVKQDRPLPVDCSFNKVFTMAGKDVKFRAIVNTVEQDGIVIPKFSTIECAMGTRTVCNNCGVPVNFGDQQIDWSEHRRDLASSLTERNTERWTILNVLGKPGSCPQCRVIATDYYVGCRWTAVQDDPEESGDRELIILSEQMPTLSGEVEIEGSVYPYGAQIIVFAHKLRQLDRAEVNLEPYVVEITDLCPKETAEVEEIDAFLTRRAHDLSVNVTHIYGREEAHIGLELLAHSVTWIKPEQDRVRGWLDVAIIGDTRSGKSMVARRLLTHYGVGEIHTCMENISRAGMTIGAAPGGAHKLKPGLFPRTHRKMLFLDEAHVMIEKSKENPMLHLQSARDVGTVGGVKIYGSRTLAACVRLGAIFNWARGDIRSFQFPCQHLLYLYGAPESLSRMDYAVAVIGMPDPRPDEIPHVWTRELCKTLILRSWAMTEDMVHFDKGVVKLAEQVCEDWVDTYSEELPLFTRKEKPYSLLRAAVAIANMTFSHPPNQFDHCLVRKCHVRWAAKWLERTWANLGYDEMSAKVLHTQEVGQPFTVEKYLTCKMGLKDADNGMRIFPEFFGHYSKQKLSALLGMESHEAERWLSEMIRLGAMQVGKSINGYHVEIGVTKGGHQILRNLYVLSSEFPEEYARRYRLLDTWMSDVATSSPDMTPLSAPTHNLRREWHARTGTDGHRETNIHPGPTSGSPPF